MNIHAASIDVIATSNSTKMDIRCFMLNVFVFCNTDQGNT